jgi:hypothetical protein
MSQDDIILPLDYLESEVVAAQRARFRHSTRPRLGLLFGLMTLVLLGVSRLAGRTGGAGRAGGPNALVPVLVLLICFAGVLLFAWRLAPLVDFRTNPNWRRLHRLRFTEEALFLESPDGIAGSELPWRAVRRVLETRHAYVLVYRSEREFLIVPKRVLGGHEAVFRERIRVRPAAKY